VIYWCLRGLPLVLFAGSEAGLDIGFLVALAGGFISSLLTGSILIPLI
jgi:hypothetical protein